MNQQTNNNFRPADAFLNVRVADKNGDFHQLKGIALYETRSVDKGLIGMKDINQLIADGRVELTIKPAVSDTPTEF